MPRIFLPKDWKFKATRAVTKLNRRGVVGACFWCGHGYREYSPKLEDEHFAYHCTDAPAELKKNARSRLKVLHQAERISVSAP
jgi:hypothetical protein